MEWNDPEKLNWLADNCSKIPGSDHLHRSNGGPSPTRSSRSLGSWACRSLGGSYFTFSNENNYMIWKLLKKCWENGWLYRGADVMPWCPRCATGISQHEIVTDGYMELTHRSVTLRFPSAWSGKANRSWFGRRHPGPSPAMSPRRSVPISTYVKVRNGEDILYLSKGTLHMLKGEYEVLGELKGQGNGRLDLRRSLRRSAGSQHPGRCDSPQETGRGHHHHCVEVHQVILWDEVSEAEGTGIVHIAPGCGAEDFQLGQRTSTSR